MTNIFDPPESSSDRLEISPIAETDGPAVQELFVDDPAVTRFVSWKPMADESRAQSFAESEASAWSRRRDCRGWIAREHTTGRVVACAIARRKESKGEFSYVVRKDEWNRGFGTELVRAILYRARRDPELEEMWAICDVDNASSRRVLEKAGMALDTVLEKHQTHNVADEPRDCVRFVVGVEGT